MEEQRRQAAAARAKAITDEATTRHRQAKAKIWEQRAATAWGKALAQATAERHCRKAATADALAEITRQSAKLAKAKRHEDALATEERQRASLAAAETLMSGWAAIRADMAELARAVEAFTLVKERRRHEAVLAAEADD